MLPEFGRRLLRDRAWTIEGGDGAGLKFRLPQNHDYLTGTSELPVQQALAGQLRPGGVFYDVGANVGFFSLLAAKRLGPAGCVCAFEPVAENAASVRANAKINRFANINVFELAAGRTSGTAELLLTDWDGGGSLSNSAVRPSEPVSRRQVRVVALDDWIPAERLPKPGVVKIDVEGVELEVLQGMSKTIAEFKPVLLYEVDDGRKDSFHRRWKELDDYVAGFGYSINHLKSSYANSGWNVGHTLALPR
jgi:FkbM family methyltransferase